MLIFNFLITTILKIYIKLFLLLYWAWLVKCDFKNPIVQFLLNIVKPILNKLNKIFLISYKYTNVVPLILAYLFNFLYLLICIFEKNIFNFNINIFFINFLSLIKTTGNLIFWIMSSRSLVKIIDKKYNAIFFIIYQLTDPIIYILKKFLPTKINNNINYIELIIVFSLYIFNLIGKKFIYGWQIL